MNVSRKVCAARTGHFGWEGCKRAFWASADCWVICPEREEAFKFLSSSSRGLSPSHEALHRSYQTEPKWCQAVQQPSRLLHQTPGVPAGAQGTRVCAMAVLWLLTLSSASACCSHFDYRFRMVVVHVWGLWIQGWAKVSWQLWVCETQFLYYLFITVLFSNNCHLLLPMPYRTCLFPVLSMLLVMGSIWGSGSFPA